MEVELGWDIRRRLLSLLATSVSQNQKENGFSLIQLPPGRFLKQNVEMLVDLSQHQGSRQSNGILNQLLDIGRQNEGGHGLKKTLHW